MTRGFTKGKKLVCAAFLFLVLGSAAITGIGGNSNGANGVPAAYAGCDGGGTNPPITECQPTPTPTATPGND